MAGDDAEIKVKLTGADEAAKKAKDLLSSIDKLGKGISSTVSSIAGVGVGQLGQFGILASLVNSAAKAVGDYASAIVDMPEIDFDKQKQSANAFQDSITRLSLRGTSGMDLLSHQVNNIAGRFGILPNQVLSGVEAFTDLTYSSDGSAVAIEAIANEANKTGESITRLFPLAQELATTFSISKDEITRGFTEIQAAADAMQVAGGARGLGDSLVKSKSALQLVDMTSPEKRFQMYGLFGQLTQGRSREDADAITQSVLQGMNSVLTGTTRLEAMRLVGGTKNFEKYFDTRQGKWTDFVGFLDAVQKRVLRNAGNPQKASAWVTRLFQDPRAAGAAVYTNLWGLSHATQFPGEEEPLTYAQRLQKRADRIYSEDSSGYAQTVAGLHARMNVADAQMELQKGQELIQERDEYQAKEMAGMSFDDYMKQRYREGLEKKYLPGFIVKPAMAAAAALSSTGVLDNNSMEDLAQKLNMTPEERQQSKTGSLKSLLPNGATAKELARENSEAIHSKPMNVKLNKGDLDYLINKGQKPGQELEAQGAGANLH